MSGLSEAIAAWSALADEAERGAALGIIHPNVARVQVETYRRTVRAMEMQQETGVAVCSCCHKPFGEGMKHGAYFH